MALGPSKLLVAVCAVGVALTTACARGPTVRTSDALPLRNVVLHRNGVGYYERAGRFEGDELVFQVRRRDVGDFLATLAAVEKGDGRVDSVSFEVDEPEPPKTPPEGEDEAAALRRDPAEDLVDVRLRFSGRDHDLAVSYVVAAPIWKPTYRLVLGDDGRALLQAWAVVQNVTGEDWDDVGLSLTTGTPIAFESDLATPVTPRRPRVTDRGDVVAAVPDAETTYGDAVEEEAAAEDGDAAIGGLALEGEARGYGSRSGSAAPRRPRMRSAPAPEAPPPPPGGVSRDDLGRSAVMAASATRLADGVTRYDLARRVTVPDGGSTMVVIVSDQVPGEAVHLFAPEPGVADSQRHPFRVARLTNATGTALERGPLTIYGGEGFLGQGVLGQMAAGAGTFVPFALDRTIAVSSEVDVSQGGARLVRIVDGRVTVDSYTARKTRYTVRNGGSAQARVFLRHRQTGAGDLHEPPDGTETTADGALVPVVAPAREEATLVVEERSPVRRTVDVLSPLFREAAAVYLEGDDVDEQVGPALRQALDIQRELGEIGRSLGEAQRARSEVRQTANQARESLEALRRVDGARDLRARLVRRLEEADRRDDELTRRIVDLETRRSELQVRLREAIAEVELGPTE